MIPQSLIPRLDAGRILGTGDRIRHARIEEQATLVVKHGGRKPLSLIFEGRVTIGAVRRFCSAQHGWNLTKLAVSVDGTHYDVSVADRVILEPPTDVIIFGAVAPTVNVRHVEFRQKTSGLG